jgi:uncharacterized membrane protein
MAPRFAAACLIVSLTACGGPEPSAPPSAASSPTPSVGHEPLPATNLPEPAPIRQRLAGMVATDKDGFALTACGAAPSRRVTFSQSASAFLDAFLHNGAKEFFIDGWMEVAPDGAANVVAIERADVVSGCDTPGLEALIVRAGAKEPAWTVEVRRDQAVLALPGSSPLVADYRPLETLPDGRRVFEGGTFSLLLTPGFCRGNMAEAAFGWTATVDFGDEELEGCGFFGRAEP